MFTVQKPEADRVDIRIRGRIDEAEMRAGLDALVAAAEGVEAGVMLYTIDALEMPEMAALRVEFARLAQLLSLIGRFRRCAVVTDAGWIARWAEIEGRLIPGLEIRSFPHDDRAAAVAWLEERAES